MVRQQLPIHVDEIFVIALILIVLMINYNMPLASIYQSFVYLTLFMYLVPIIFNLFKWISLSDKQNRIKEIAVGIGAGIAFIWFYNYLGSITPMANVFATTAFGESVSLGKFVFGFLIPTIETIFFFVILPSWYLWKIGKSFHGNNILSFDNIVMVVIFSAIFTIVHTTAKGLTNNLDLIATFAFGALSIFLILYFKTVLPAIILHIVVNAYSVEIFEPILNGALLSSPYIIIGVIGVVAYLLSRRRGTPFFG